MDSLSLDADRVNLRFPRLLHTKRYFVPNTPSGEKPRTAAIGYFDTGDLCSIRTSNGRRYEADEIAFLISILDEAESDGLHKLKVIVNYRKRRISVTYSTTIENLRHHGRTVFGVSGWELSMSRSLWSIDGAAPLHQDQKCHKHEAVAMQPALFEFVESRRGGY